MKSILVDDEPKARIVLSKLLSFHCPEVTVAASCKNLTEARQALLEHQPDLVFLDLHLSQEFGLDLVQNMRKRHFALVLTTAHEDHALKAFELNAQDYLLKPIVSTRLIQAVDRATQFIRSNTADVRQLAPVPSSNLKVERIPLPVEDGIEMVELSRIIRVEAQGSYSKFHLIGQRPLLISKNMKPLEQMLAGHSFFRVHNSHLINIQHLKKVQRIDGGFAVMSDDSTIEISRRKMSAFLQFLGQGTPV